MTRAVDLFSGGGAGWCLAARELGIDTIGLEWGAPECATRAVVGLPTIRTDVSTYPAERFAGKVEGVMGSPPCQSFSSAGKRNGLADPRGQMIYEPMRYVRAIQPRWVALEQVPEVLGYWRWIARELRTMGYSAWAGILNAADYGVPQIRKRAILLASLDRRAEPPTPTHSKTGAGDLFGGQLPKWVTMAEALGWGLTERPAYVVASADGGGDHSGGSGQRRMIRKAHAEGRWLDTRRGQTPDGTTQTRSVDEPAPTVGTSESQRVLRTQTNTGGSPQHPEDRLPYECGIDRPAPTVLNNSAGRRADAATEPAPTVALGHNAAAWCWEGPATTVAADARVFGPHSGGNGDSQSTNAIPVEPWELGVLQGFPADHPWQPPHVSRQIGNALPPPLALACLRSLVGPV